MTVKAAAAVATLLPGRLTVCTYGGFAPVCYKNPADQLIGLDVSFLTRFAESLGLAIVTIEKPFDGIWTLPGENVCDVAGAGIMRRDDRIVGSGGSWSDAYFQVDRSLLVRAGTAGNGTGPPKAADPFVPYLRRAGAKVGFRACPAGAVIHRHRPQGADSGHRGTNRARCFVDPLR
jgi:ABC-type amino acid transport substrate-binding protein